MVETKGGLFETRCRHSYCALLIIICGRLTRQVVDFLHEGTGNDAEVPTVQVHLPPSTPLSAGRKAQFRFMKHK